MDRRHATLLLRRLGEGDGTARDELVPLLYDELHRIARAHMAAERAGHTLQPTALVHEAWMRLFDLPDALAGDRQHFLSIAARVMRRVLVDHARARLTDKRGGDRTRLPLDDALQLYEQHAVDVPALDEALQKLAQMDEELAKLVELRFFGGLTNAEAAQVLGLSLRSAERGWATARAWLKDVLER
ncbi:MAG: sigma-70 family RNA polymerase sigma factor [Planctomycetes bacterium]|nr:sigma-70 family RNA polymerase sigma factor [Planctomycetota bacterium]